MANNVSNYLKIIGTDEVIAEMDKRFENAGGYNDVLKFSQAFYDNVETDESGNAVMYSWTLDNLGAKWVYVENQINDGEWNIQSANHCPQEFFVHLYKLAVQIDPEVQIEVKFHDESYEPVGGFVAKKDYQGKPAWSMEENYDIENPTDDMDWDDEGYDDAQMKFQEDLEDMMTDLCNTAHDNVWSIEGNPIEL